MKIFKFGFSILWLLVGSIVSIGCYSLNVSIQDDSTRLSLIIFIPIIVILMILEYCSTVGSTFGFAISIRSESKVIKIMSIIFLIISLALLGFIVYNTVTFFKIV